MFRFISSSSNLNNPSCTCLYNNIILVFYIYMFFQKFILDSQNFGVGRLSSFQYDIDDYYIFFPLATKEIDTFDPFLFSQPKILNTPIWRTIKAASN